MTFGEAIDKLKEQSEFDEYGYALALKAVRPQRRLWVIRYKFGLAQCTHDWPQPYSPSLDDLDATDWEIENS